jgi:hypothetical protein
MRVLCKTAIIEIIRQKSSITEHINSDKKESRSASSYEIGLISNSFSRPISLPINPFAAMAGRRNIIESNKKFTTNTKMLVI